MPSTTISFPHPKKSTKEIPIKITFIIQSFMDSQNCLIHGKIGQHGGTIFRNPPRREGPV